MTTLIPYKTMPVWTKDTIPSAVTNQHNTQAGTWGKLRVLAGRLKFRELTEGGATTAEHILTPETGVWKCSMMTRKGSSNFTANPPTTSTKNTA